MLKTLVEERIAALKLRRDGFIREAEHEIAAMNGAIMELEHLLGELTKEPESDDVLHGLEEGK
jgi:hypothetical protein